MSLNRLPSSVSETSFLLISRQPEPPPARPGRNAALWVSFAGVAVGDLAASLIFWTRWLGPQEEWLMLSLSVVRSLLVLILAWEGGKGVRGRVGWLGLLSACTFLAVRRPSQVVKRDETAA